MEDQLLLWRQAALSWHLTICPCTEPWKHLLPRCTPTTAARGEGDGDAAVSGDGVESLLSAAAFLADEGGSGEGSSKDHGASRDWYSGTPQ